MLRGIMKHGLASARNAGARTHAKVKPQEVAAVRRWLRRVDVCLEFGISLRTLGKWQRSHLVPFREVKRLILFERSEAVVALNRFRVAAIGEKRGGETP